MRYVYIVECSDESFYTGVTKDLEKRLDEHNSSDLGAKYTKSRRPVCLRWSYEVTSRSQACSLERHIKRFSRQKKKRLVNEQDLAILMPYID